MERMATDSCYRQKVYRQLLQTEGLQTAVTDRTSTDSCYRQKVYRQLLQTEGLPTAVTDRRSTDSCYRQKVFLHICSVQLNYLFKACVCNCCLENYTFLR